MGEERTCKECGEGTSREKGTPASYGDSYAHVDCAHDAGYDSSHSDPQFSSNDKD